MLKKVLVFGLPRTGTTVLQIALSDRLGIPNLAEPYKTIAKDDAYQWTQQLDHGVVKLLTTDLSAYDNQLNIVKLMKQGFDGLVITNRNNPADAIISLYYAEVVVKKYHYTTYDKIPMIPFEFDLNRKMLLGQVRIYLDTVKMLDQAGIEYHIFDYDYWCQGKSQTVLSQNITPTDGSYIFVNSKIDYSSLCKNYHDVQAAIKNLIDDPTK